MNKNVINQEIEIAYKALAECGIAKGGKINKSFRGQISSFGAAVTMGSLLSAIAFFSEKAGCEVERDKLLDAILYILKKEGKAAENYTNLFDYAKETDAQIAKENIINAAIALKLAMNLYDLVSK